jgi:hypothetical protein
MIKKIIVKIFFYSTGFIQHNKKNSRCFACNKQTLGIFHQAKEIINKMEKESKSQNIETKEEDSDD